MKVFFVRILSSVKIFFPFFLHVLKSKIFKIIIHSTLLLFLTYFWLNVPFSHDSEDNLFANFAHIKTYFHDAKLDKELNKDIICINTSYSKMLVPYDFNREVAITDREELTSLFSTISQYNNHRYIICDIMFEANSECDHQLDLVLKNAERIVVPEYINNSAIVKPIFSVESGLVSYLSSFYSGQFSKYRIIINDSLNTLPYILYHNIEKKKVEKKGWFYFENNKLSLNSIFIDFKIYTVKRNIRSGFSTDETDNLQYYDLTQFLKLLHLLSEEEILRLFEDKMILIGSFEQEDIHSTVLGSIPGILILYNTYLNLKLGLHIIPITLIIVLFLIYCLLSYSVFYNLPFLRFLSIERISKNSIWVLVSTIFTYALLFICLSVLFYTIFGVTINFYAIIFYFSLLDLAVKFLQKRKERKLQKMLKKQNL